MIRAIDLAPDGKYVRVTRMLKPFSYDVPVSNFGQIEEIWDDGGKVLAKVSDRPLNLGVAGPDDTPNPDPQPRSGRRRRGGGNQAGKREVAWRTDGQGLTYVEQEPAPARAPGQAWTCRGGQRHRCRRPATGGRTPRRRWRRPDAAAQGSRLPVDGAVRRCQPEGDLRERDAPLGPPLLARHAGAVLQRARRTERDRNRGLSERRREEVHAGALSRG